MDVYDSSVDTYKHISVIRGLLIKVIKEILDRAHGHDASKLKEPELTMFNEVTGNLKNSTYGSDEYKGFLADMGDGLSHHYANNRHHPEHHAEGITGMNLIDITEMLCDWKAATQRHADGDIRRSLEIQQERFGYSDELKKILLNTIEWLEGKDHE